MRCTLLIQCGLDICVLGLQGRYLGATVEILLGDIIQILTEMLIHLHSAFGSMLPQQYLHTNQLCVC